MKLDLKNQIIFYGLERIVKKLEKSIIVDLKLKSISHRMKFHNNRSNFDKFMHIQYNIYFFRDKAVKLRELSVFKCIFLSKHHRQLHKDL